MPYPVWHSLRGTIDANTEPVSLADAKFHLRISGNTQDALIAALCTAAREDCEHATSRALVAGSFTLKLSALPCGSIVLPVGGPVSNVVVAYVDADGATQTLDANTVVTLQRDASFPELYAESWPDTACQPDAVTVTWDVTPVVSESLKASMKLQLAFLFENRDPTKVETDAIENLRAPSRLVGWV